MDKSYIRQKQQELFGQQANIADICLDLRGSLNGSADPLSDNKTLEIISFLKLVVDNWHVSLLESEREIDNAFLQLAIATIRYAEIKTITKIVIGVV